jgi:hypothetical protein
VSPVAHGVRNRDRPIVVEVSAPGTRMGNHHDMTPPDLGRGSPAGEVLAAAAALLALPDAAIVPVEREARLRVALDRLALAYAGVSGASPPEEETPEPKEGDYAATRAQFSAAFPHLRESGRAPPG